MTNLRAALRTRLRGLGKSAKATPGAKARGEAGDLIVAAPKVQQHFWCLDQLAAGQGIVNVSRAWDVSGAFDPDRCHQVLKALAKKYDCLRSGFKQSSAGLQMIISQDKTPDFAVVDLRQTSAEGEQASRIEAVLAAEGLRDFDAENGPLLRLRAYHIADRHWVLCLVYHHAIMDGWSLGQFCQELGQMYEVLGDQCAPVIHRPEFDFADYASDLANKSPEIAALQDLTYLGSHLAATPELTLPFDYAPPSVPSYIGNSTSVRISGDTRAALETLAGRLHVSPISVLLAAYRIALSQISGQPDFCIGNTAMTRNAPGLQQMLGAFVETLPIRNPLLDGVSFEQICRSEQAALALALEQGEQEPVALNPQPTVKTHLEAVLNYRGFTTRQLSLSGCEVQTLALAGRSTPFSLALNLENAETGLTGELVWNAARFTADTAARIVRQFSNILQDALDCPTAAIETLAGSEGADRVLHCPQVLPSLSVTKLLDQVFAQYGDLPAIECGDLSLTYSDLDRESAAWARAVLQAPGAAGDLVALALPRGAEFVAALVGILRAGRAFLPLSPQDPPDRLKRILQQADPKHLIAQPDLAQVLEFPPLSVCAGDAAAHVDCNSNTQEGEDLAYVMFTSGSTGAPKGVAIPHRALANYLSAVRDVFAPRVGERLLSSSATTFDSIIYEVLLPLVTGGHLVMIEERFRRDPWHIIDKMRANPPQHFFATPSMWRMLLEAGLPNLPGLKALAGGEPLNPGLAAQIRQRVDQLFNVYGPTEATVFSTWKEVAGETQGMGGMADLVTEQLGGLPTPALVPVGSPIGEPFPGYSLAVVGASGRPVWPGMTGEIWIAGAGIATGYYKSEERTGRSFPRAEIAGGPERWYRTGDLGRVLADGTVSCVGRIDDQLKISGQRVEPGEIENLLLASGLVANVAVFAVMMDTQPVLVSFYIGQNSADETRVRQYLRDNLPAAWVPGLIVGCSSLPMTSSGKLDRATLRSRAKQVLEASDGAADLGVALAPAVEQSWHQTLGRAPSCADQDFFAAGGNSLLLITLLARLRELTGCHLPVAQAFGNPTPVGLHALLEKAVPQDLHKALVCTKDGNGSNPLVFLPGLAPTGPNLSGMMQQAPTDQSCYLLQRPVSTSTHATRSFADQARYYAKILAHSYQSHQIHLTGFSYGGAEAFETARQLDALGVPPANLTIIDNGPVFRKLGPGDTSWGEAGLQAEYLRRAHEFQSREGDLKLVRGERLGLLSLAMIGYGWEDFVTGEVAVHIVNSSHNALLHEHAQHTMQAMAEQQIADVVLRPLPGAADRRRAAHLVAARDFDTALDHLWAISREHPKHPWVAVVADQLATDMGQDSSDQLASWVETASETPPESVPALAWHAARARALTRLKQPVAALSAVKAARQSIAGSGRLLRDLETRYGDLLQEVGRPEEAITVLTRVQNRCGFRPDIGAFLGISFAQTGDFRQALPLLQAAQGSDHRPVVVNYWLEKAKQALVVSD